MAFGKDEDVPIRPKGIGRFATHFLSVEQGQNIGNGKGSAYMTNPEFTDGIEGLLSDIPGILHEAGESFRIDHDTPPI
jgi:hypothetical protein